jgi:hypothetical protein
VLLLNTILTVGLLLGIARAILERAGTSSKFLSCQAAVPYRKDSRLPT